MSLASQVALLATRIAQEINTRGMPKGGSTGQVLAKTAGTNFSAAWTAPGGYPQRRAVLTQSASTSIAANTYVTTPFDTVVAAPNNDIVPTDTPKQLVRVPLAGIWRITFRCALGGGTSNIFLRLYKNNAISLGVRYFASIPDTSFGVEITETAVFAAGDTVQAQAQSNSGNRAFVTANDELRPKITMEYLGPAA